MLTPSFHMKYSSMELVLFEKLHNIQLSRVVFRVTTFFQFDSIKSSINTLLQYAQDLYDNIKILNSKLVSNNYDQKSHMQTNEIYPIHPY